MYWKIVFNQKNTGLNSSPDMFITANSRSLSEFFFNTLPRSTLIISTLVMSVHKNSAISGELLSCGRCITSICHLQKCIYLGILIILMQFCTSNVISHCYGVLSHTVLYVKYQELTWMLQSFYHCHNQFSDLYSSACPQHYLIGYTPRVIVYQHWWLQCHRS